MAEQDGEKSQDATPHRRQEAREQGQVVQSQDLASAVLLVVGLSLILTLGGGVMNYVADLTREQLGGEAWLTADPQSISSWWMSVATGLGGAMLPILGLIVLADIAVHMGQIGFLFLPDKLALDFSRIDPLQGLSRLFSLSSTVRLVFGIFKILIVAAVAFGSLYHRRDEILAIASLELPQIASVISEIVLWTSLKISSALLLLAIVDYGFQRWKHEQDLKMTPQEMREEMKNMQGDPQMAQRRRSMQRAMVQNRLATAVPKADVIVTNPTELAIAIQYDPKTMRAPIVVAKGAGILAQQIRRLGLENAIPIVEKKPLAQTLYKEVDVNHPIPDKAFAAVAEVLAYVYQLKGKPLPGQGK